MTDKYLNNLINTLNKKQRREHIFIRELTKNVDLAKIYTDTPKMTDNLGSNDLLPYTFYCIKNENKQYISIVLDMNRDLHWFVKKEYRRNGYLTKALKNCILPFIFQQERDEQRITISKYEIGKENFIASQKVATRLWFILQNEENEKCEYLLKSEDFIEIDWIEGYNNELSKEELKNIAKKVSFYSKKLMRLQIDLEMRYGFESETIVEFRERIAKLRHFTNRIEDIWYENKKHE